MKNIVITIERQYGSGGKSIGKSLAERLNIEYYNHDIITLASEASGIDEALFAKVDEKLVNNNIFKFKKIYTGDLLAPGSDNFTSDSNLFNVQADTIKKLAEHESCVIIGRCANYILKDYENVVSVFVHANDEFCQNRIRERVSLEEKDIPKFIEKTNKYRNDYYKYHTGHEWFDLRAYDLCLDSGKLGFEKCVDEILAYIKVRFDN